VWAEIFIEERHTRRLNPGAKDRFSCHLEHLQGTGVRIIADSSTAHGAVAAIGADAAAAAFAHAASKSSLSGLGDLSGRLTERVSFQKTIDTNLLCKEWECFKAGLDSLYAISQLGDVQIQGFVERQLVSVETVGAISRSASDRRFRWGASVELCNHGKNGSGLLFERSCGGSDLPEKTEFDAIAADLKEIIDRVRTASVVQSVAEGNYPIVLSGAATGMLMHEVIGHMCEEANIVAGGESLQMGKRVGPESLCVCDDAGFRGLFGAKKMDDAGFPTSRIPLIVNGTLSAVLVQAGSPLVPLYRPVACSARQDFRYQPMSRMSNTIVEARQGSATEFIAALRSGFFVTKIAEGTFDARSRHVTLIATEAFNVCGGAIAGPVAPFLINGVAEEILNRIDAIGSDTSSIATYCRSGGMTIPVGMSAPSCSFSTLHVEPLLHH
jgi:predicted Zn-dependent protease